MKIEFCPMIHCYVDISSNSSLILGFAGIPTLVQNATVLTASGQPIHLAQPGLGGPQKLIVTQPGGQRLIVPAQLISNGPSVSAAAAHAAASNMTLTSAGGQEVKKEGSEQSAPEFINPGRQILASQQLSLFPTSTLTERIETHKIITTPIGATPIVPSGTPIILQTAGALTSLQP